MQALLHYDDALLAVSIPLFVNHLDDVHVQVQHRHQHSEMGQARVARSLLGSEVPTHTKPCLKQERRETKAKPLAQKIRGPNSSIVLCTARAALSHFTTHWPHQGSKMLQAAEFRL